MSALEILPEIAREAIRARLLNTATDLPRPVGALAEPHPVFVTLRVDGELRGCIGSLEATHDDLIAETADRACAAAFEDPRFTPLTPAEFDLCTVDVSVLGPMERIAGAAELEPARYGVVVEDDLGRRGVLLPSIPGIDDADQQISIVRRKAGIPPDAPISLWRFEVTKVEE